MKRIGSIRRKTRSIYTKEQRDKGKLKINRYMQEFQVGDKVALEIEPSCHEGLFFRRFQGKTGTVTAKLGKCYEVVVKDDSKQKKVITHPMHMKRMS